MLAIVVPYYKLTFFRETLVSLAAQTDQRFQVYIGNDASSENPEELLKEFKGKFNVTYKKFEENLGGTSLKKQWDRCIEMMQGEEWFMILGDDDYLSYNCVEEFYNNLNILEDEKINVVKLNSAIIDDNSVVKFNKKIEPLIKSAIGHFFDKYRYEGRSSLSEHIFRKSKYDQYGFVEMPFAWHSDDLALLEISEFGQILFLKKAQCFVRISTKSISGNPNNNKVEKWAASKIFLDRICLNLDKFNARQKVILFDIIEWQENTKNIKINIPHKLLEFYKSYGLKRVLQHIIKK